jgi:hypothetical protein
VSATTGVFWADNRIGAHAKYTRTLCKPHGVAMATDDYGNLEKYELRVTSYPATQLHCLIRRTPNTTALVSTSNTAIELQFPGEGGHRNDSLHSDVV